MSDNVVVGVRVRPLNSRETAGQGRDASLAWHVGERDVTRTEIDGAAREAQTFCFDSVFGPSSTNEDVYSTIGSPIVEAALGGFNATIFAYGQTSSGKTHTMLGSSEDLGITPRAITDVLRVAHASRTRSYLIRASYVEIYNDKIRDLLNPTSTDLSVREDKAGRVFVEAEETVVETLEDAMRLLEKGQEARHVGETKMNARSSRSHTVFSLLIESKGEDELEKSFRASSLNLVDLAGSERLKSTGASGQRAKEGAHINKSLLTLGTIINRLAACGGDPAKVGHLPYRDSKLTRLLRPALGGNARTAVLCAITPSPLHLEETVSTLKFATRAKTVTNNARRNEVTDYRSKYKAAAVELEVLRAEVAALRAAAQKEASDGASLPNGIANGVAESEESKENALAEVVGLRVDVQSAKEEIKYLRQHVDEVETENEHLREVMKKKNTEFKALRTRALELRHAARRARQKERATCRALILSYRKLEEARGQLEMSRKKGSHVLRAEAHLEELSTKLRTWLPEGAAEETAEYLGQPSPNQPESEAIANGAGNAASKISAAPPGTLMIEGPEPAVGEDGRQSSESDNREKSGSSGDSAADDSDRVSTKSTAQRRRRVRPLPEDMVADIDDEETEEDDPLRIPLSDRPQPGERVNFEDLRPPLDPSLLKERHRRVSSAAEGGLHDVAMWRDAMKHRRTTSVSDDPRRKMSLPPEDVPENEMESATKPKGWKAFKSFYGYGYTRGSVYDALVGGHRVPSAAKHVSA